MQLFYTPDIRDGFAYFDEEESRHLHSVLRRQSGDRLSLTDGKGFFYETELTEVGKKQALARILSSKAAPAGRAGKLHVAIASTKQIERFEWFLEKAVEIGIHAITPLHCQRSERDTIRHDRLEKILVSAMKQSLRAFLPLLHPLTKFESLVSSATEPQKRIAWCGDEPMPHLKETLQPGPDTLILIGPEGDFSAREVDLALQKGFSAISLGDARLRTETAGVFSVAVFNLL